MSMDVHAHIWRNCERCWMVKQQSILKVLAEKAQLGNGREGIRYVAFLCSNYGVKVTKKLHERWHNCQSVVHLTALIMQL